MADEFNLTEVTAWANSGLQTEDKRRVRWLLNLRGKTADNWQGAERELAATRKELEAVADNYHKAMDDAAYWRKKAEAANEEIGRLHTDYQRRLKEAQAELEIRSQGSGIIAGQNIILFKLIEILLTK